MDCSTLSRWATPFREGCVTKNYDPRPGRPKTLTDEGSVELVADFLAVKRVEKSNLSATHKNFYGRNQSSSK
jgi:hypothetical protein